MAERVLYELGRPGVVASPDGCAACGWPERGHLIWYVNEHLVPGVPQTYVRPDDATRLARMKLRRAARESLVAAEADDLCRCSWLGAGTPPHERSNFCTSVSAPYSEQGGDAR